MPCSLTGLPTRVAAEPALGADRRATASESRTVRGRRPLKRNALAATRLRRRALLSSEIYAALIGASVGGVLALLGSGLTALIEGRRRLEDARRRDAEWRREKCNEAYSQTIYYLFKLKVSSTVASLDDKDVRQHLSEAQRYLALLQAYHPLENVRTELRAASDRLIKSTGPELRSSAESARRTVEESLTNMWGPAIRK